MFHTIDVGVHVALGGRSIVSLAFAAWNSETREHHPSDFGKVHSLLCCAGFPNCTAAACVEHDGCQSGWQKNSQVLMFCSSVSCLPGRVLTCFERQLAFNSAYRSLLSNNLAGQLWVGKQGDLHDMVEYPSFLSLKKILAMKL